MTKEIKLSRGLVALVDDDDFEYLNQFKWYVDGRNACRHEPKNHSHTISMHREIMQANNNFWVDHINHNPLDNRKSNLRLCSRIENSRNRLIGSNNKVGYKGVHFNKSGNTYRAYIRVNGKPISLGCYLFPINAALAYDRAAKNYFGNFSSLNFPD